MRCALAGPVLLLLAASAVAVDAPDLSGIWISEKAGLVIHQDAERSFVGEPTDLRGIPSITWHFYGLGGKRYRFWIIVHGKGSEQKFAEQEMDIEGDTMTVPVASARGLPGQMEFTRRFRRLPPEIGDVKVSFRAVRKEEPDPDQYVDVRLVATFEKAVLDAKKICPDLKRILVTATVGTQVYGSPHYRRDRRTGLAIGEVNGVDLVECGAGVVEAARRIRAGEPPVSSRESYPLAALALLACLAVQEEVVEVASSDLLDSAAAPFHDWFLDRHWGRLPGHLLRDAWGERWTELVRQGSSGKFRGRLHVAVKPREWKTRLKDVWDERYDRR